MVLNSVTATLPWIRQPKPLQVFTSSPASVCCDWVCLLVLIVPYECVLRVCVFIGIDSVLHRRIRTRRDMHSRRGMRTLSRESGAKRLWRCLGSRVGVAVARLCARCVCVCVCVCVCARARTHTHTCLCLFGYSCAHDLRVCCRRVLCLKSNYQYNKGLI